MRRIRIAALVGVVLMVGGCATIPLETKPEAVRADTGGANEAEISPPEKDLSATSVARAFVEANALDMHTYAASRQYLSEAMAESWQPSKRVTVLDTDFSTIPERRENNKIVVRVTGHTVGNLDPNNSFIPVRDNFEETITLTRRSDGQWRISNVSNQVFTNMKEFSRNYWTARLFYYAPSSDVMVPDLRYIPSLPSEGMSGRVVDALLAGPSDLLAGAVDNPLSGAALDTNVRKAGNAVEVPLTGLSNKTKGDRERIVAQVVMSLEHEDLVQVLSEGEALVGDRKGWRRADLKAAAPDVAESDGYAVNDAGSLVSLNDNKPVPSAGGLQVLSAAQSIEGEQLAAVVREGDKQRLRIGTLNDPLQNVPITGKNLTRPSWQPAYPGNSVSSEVWTVKDGRYVVLARLTEANTWVKEQIPLSPTIRSIAKRNGKITALRLSRDGTRAAMVIGGKLVVVGVVRGAESVELGTPRMLRPTPADVVDVDWSSQYELVVATTSARLPVVETSVDGFRVTHFSAANLEVPTGIAARTDGTVLVTDDNGLWTVSSTSSPWDAQRYSGRGFRSPVYPG